MAETFAGFYFVILIFLVILAVCWIVLPFALIGTKPILRDILKEQRRTNALLEQRLPDLRPRISPQTQDVERVEPKRVVDHFLPYELRKK